MKLSLSAILPYTKGTSIAITVLESQKYGIFMGKANNQTIRFEIKWFDQIIISLLSAFFEAL
jgi:hypothetical protein